MSRNTKRLRKSETTEPSKKYTHSPVTPLPSFQPRSYIPFTDMNASDSPIIDTTPVAAPTLVDVPVVSLPTTSEPNTTQSLTPIEEWCHLEGLAYLAPIFAQHDILLEHLVLLSDADLTTMGISFGMQFQFRNAVKAPVPSFSASTHGRKSPSN